MGLLVTKGYSATFDAGTPDEQTVRFPPQCTPLMRKIESVLDKVINNIPLLSAKEEGIGWSRDGLYMSGPWAHRASLIWRRNRYDVFWGDRTRNGKRLEFRKTPIFWRN